MPIFNANTFLGKFLWANIPAASAVPVGSQILVTNLGQSGVFMFTNGAFWRPLGGVVEMLSQTVSITTIANTSEQIFTAAQVTFPAGFLQIGCQIQTKAGFSKSGTADTMSTRYRLGSAGTTGDNAFGTTGALTTTSISAGIILDGFIASATTFQKGGSGTVSASLSGPSSTAVPAATAIANISGANIFSISNVASIGSETVTLLGLNVAVVFP